jgi:hypothetical protein
LLSSSLASVDLTAAPARASTSTLIAAMPSEFVGAEPGVLIQANDRVICYTVKSCVPDFVSRPNSVVWLFVSCSISCTCREHPPDIFSALLILFAWRNQN